MGLRIVALCCLGLATLAASARGSSSPGKLAYLSSTDGYWQVWTLEPDTGKSRQLTTSPYEKTRVSWFPDGTAVLVNSLDGRLYRVDAETGHEQPIQLPLGGMTDAVLSPNGIRLTFSRTTADHVDGNDIWVANLDGTGLRRLTSLPGLQHEPEWSADGSWVYFLSNDGSAAQDIWRVSTRTGATQQLTAGLGLHFDLHVGPEGWLAFSSDRGQRNYDIWAWKPDGQASARRITQHPALDARPVWVRGGAEIVFHSSRSGVPNLWITSVGGTAPRQLTRHAEGARAPDWWEPGATK